MMNAKETVNAMNDLGNKGYESLRQLGELQMATWNKLMEKQLEVFNAAVDGAVESAKLAGEAKDYQEAVTAQAELSRKLAEQMANKTRETVELVQEAGEEYRGWIEGVAKDAGEQANKVVAQAA
jgi:phasin family protein